MCCLKTTVVLQVNIAISWALQPVFTTCFTKEHLIVETNWNQWKEWPPPSRNGLVCQEEKPPLSGIWLAPSSIFCVCLLSYRLCCAKSNNQLWHYLHHLCFSKITFCFWVFFPRLYQLGCSFNLSFLLPFCPLWFHLVYHSLCWWFPNKIVLWFWNL